MCVPEVLCNEIRMGTESTKELLKFICALADRAQWDSVFNVAERLYREILQILSDWATGAHRHDTAIANHWQAFSFFSLGKPKEAKERLLQGLNEFEHLSSLREWRTTFFGYVGIHEKYVDICTRIFDEGLNHLGLANVLHQTGLDAWDKGACETTKLKFTSSLAMKMRLIDDEKGDKSVPQTLFKLGRVMRAKAELDEAEKSLRKALDIVQGTVGAETDCEDALMSMYKLSCVLGERGELKEDELLMRKALGMGKA